MDLSFWSGRFLKINVMSVIRKDFPYIVREILTDVAIASHPSTSTANFRGTWIYTPEYKDAWTSNRLRWQFWTFRYERPSR